METAQTIEQVQSECITTSLSVFHTVASLAYEGKLTLETDPCIGLVRGVLVTRDRTIEKEAQIQFIEGNLVDPLAVVLLELLREAKAK